MPALWVRARLKPRLVKNIQAENLTMDAEALAERVMVFFSGICIEQDMASSKQATNDRINSFMLAMRAITPDNKTEGRDFEPLAASSHF